jgi:hypothetical protein
MSRSQGPHGGPSAAARWAEEYNNPHPPETDADVRDWHEGIRLLLCGGPFNGLADSAVVNVPFAPGGRGYAPGELRYEISSPNDIRDRRPWFWCTGEQYFALYKWARRDVDGVHYYGYDRCVRPNGSIYGVVCVLMNGPHSNQMHWIKASPAPPQLTGLEGMGPTTVYELTTTRSEYPTYTLKFRCRFIGGGIYGKQTKLFECQLPFKAPKVLAFDEPPYQDGSKYRFDRVEGSANVYRYAGKLRATKVRATPVPGGGYLRYADDDLY